MRTPIAGLGIATVTLAVFALLAPPAQAVTCSVSGSLGDYGRISGFCGQRSVSLTISGRATDRTRFINGFIGRQSVSLTWNGPADSSTQFINGFVGRKGVSLSGSQSWSGFVGRKGVSCSGSFPAACLAV